MKVTNQERAHRGVQNMNVHLDRYSKYDPSDPAAERITEILQFNAAEAASDLD